MAKPNGFTLVELAIVLMIIGLLIGGILKGQELIQNARIISVASQLNGYKAAVITFQDSYGAIPGDITNAQTRLANCTSGNNCSNGDGNGMVGASSHPWSDITNVIGSENTQFWKHLALANLIGGIDSSASAVAWGSSHPTNSLTRGFFARYSLPTGLAPSYTILGNVIVSRSDIDGVDHCPSLQCSTSPSVAARVDRKLDDGIATTGSLVAFSHGWANGCGPEVNIGNSTGYTQSSTASTCDIVFNLN
jgi:prepilin-type N-terminal cleavage/methylation domain-containing protein